jgi:acyl-CoA thioesterase-1
MMKRAQTRISIFANVGRWMLAVNLALAAFALPAPSAAADKPVRIVAFGDSLTAGYRLKASQSFPSQLSAALKSKGHAVEVINAGVSGDTTGAALERFDWAIPKNVDAVIVELGANDALRGLEPKQARANLQKIVDRLRARNVEVLLAGMIAPKNWGNDYNAEFDTIFADLANKHGLLLYPFFLDGVAMDAKLNLDDGLHPSAKGVGVIVERILPKVEELIGRVQARRLAASKS